MTLSRQDSRRLQLTVGVFAELQKEQEERKAAELEVASLKRQLASLRDKCTAIDAEIEQYQAIAGNLRRGASNHPSLQGSRLIVTRATEKNKEWGTLTNLAARVSPELTAVERAISCVVEGVEKNKLLVRMTRIDKSDPEREFSFVIDVSNRVYQSSCHPAPSPPPRSQIADCSPTQL